MKQQEVCAEATGKVWKLEAAIGQQIEADDTLLVVESMKMEIPVYAPRAGKLIELRVAEGDTVDEGQVVAVLEVSA